MAAKLEMFTLAGMSSARSGMCKSPITRIRKAMARRLGRQV